MYVGGEGRETSIVPVSFCHGARLGLDASNGVLGGSGLANTCYIKVGTTSGVDTFDTAAIYSWLGKGRGGD